MRTFVSIFAGVVLGVAVTAGAGLVRGESTGTDTGWVPDLEQVYNTALENVFDAAGEKFTDPELKAFYDRLTGEITESLATPVPFDPGIEIPTATPEPTQVPPTATPVPPTPTPAPPTPTPTPTAPMVLPTPTPTP